MALFDNFGANFMPSIQRNSDALLQSGLGLLAGKTGNEQAAMGLKGFSDARKLNRTVEFLKTANPELAQAVEAGSLGAGDAYKLYYQQKLEAQKPKNNLMAVGKRLYDTSNRQWIDPPGGDSEFQVLSSGERQALGIPQTDSRVYQRGPDGKIDAVGGAGQTINVGNEVEARRQAAAQAGLTPENPSYQGFILTGKLPREDAQPLTATDKKAILEADEMVLSNQTAIDNLRSILDGKQGETLNDRAGSGWTAGMQSWAARNDPTGLFDDGKGEATTELNNVVVGNSLGQLKTIFGGNPTEGERNALRDLEASISKSPAERKTILDRTIALAEKRLEFNRQRASELRGGSYYKPNGGATSKANRTSSGLSWSVEP